MISIRLRTLPLLSSLLLGCLLAGSASGAILVNRSYIVFDPAKPREDVIISNPTNEKAYLEIEVLEVTAPGTPDEKWERATDPEKIGLIAAPRRIAIPAGGQRMVRLVNINGYDDQEHVYRLHVKPVSGGAQEVQGKGFALKVLVGYQLLLVVPPRAPVYALEAQRGGNQLVLKNNGNTNILLYDGKQCDAAGDCATVSNVRLYPGNSRSLELPRDAPVTFSVTSGKSTETRTFP